MFSQTAEYALRAVVCMAHNPDRPLTTAQMARTTKVPAGYLSKVLQSLTRAGLIRAIRGLHGGYQLARPGDQMTILEVVNAVDPVKRILCCPLDLPEHEHQLCPLHRRLDDALAMIEQVLGETTLDQVLSEPVRGGAIGDLGRFINPFGTLPQEA